MEKLIDYKIENEKQLYSILENVLGQCTNDIKDNDIITMTIDILREF